MHVDLSPSKHALGQAAAMHVDLSPSKHALGQAAAVYAAEGLRQALAAKGHANLIVATGASQFEFLQALTAADGIDWSKVTAFHLDEYIGLPVTHKASFRAYLRQRFVAALPLLAASLR
jgi:glucosamine-6-phosphate deaminase